MRISIVTAVRFVIVDFKEMNEWMHAFVEYFHLSLPSTSVTWIG